MYNSILLGIKQEQFKRYSEAFNFFQSKSINMIIGSRKMDYVVHYRDLEILDDETEYFKRYYSLKQTASRVLKLINYYELNMTPPSPNLILISTFNILETRKRKHMKLIIMQEKSLARRAEAAQETQETSEHMILQQLNESDFSEVSSQKQQVSDQDSYDSQPFYAYELADDDLRQTGVRLKETDVLSLKDFPEYQIILDFKEQPQVEPKINILPPTSLPVPPPPPPVQTASIGIQTLPIEVPQRKKTEKEAEQIKTVQIPELKKQVAMTPVSQMGLRSELKKENAVLTDSIELVQRKQQKEKARGSTFMDYYHSQPVKSPSNILEKFIKRKK